MLGPCEWGTPVEENRFIDTPRQTLLSELHVLPFEYGTTLSPRLKN